jgi:gas vesicle protein
VLEGLGERRGGQATVDNHSEVGQMRRLTIGAWLGAALAFFFDPQSGARRRAMTRDRVAGISRRKLRQAERAAEQFRSDARGTILRFKHRPEQPKDFDDVTLARKVETEIFRSPDAPKASVSVNAQEGVVQLRGEVESDQLIEKLVDSARRVQGVRAVENLLHLPGTPAPMHQ